MTVTREDILKEMRAGEKVMLYEHLWNSEFIKLPNDIKDDIKKRFLYAYMNYWYAKQKHEYYVTLRDRGLSAVNMEYGSGFTYLCDALIVDYVIAAWIVIDDDSRTNGLIGLQRIINKHARAYPILKIERLEGSILQSSNIKRLKIDRNNIIAHSGIDIIQHLENVTTTDDTIYSCFDEMFEILQIINDKYFAVSIKKEHDLVIDKKFIEDLISILPKQN